MEHWNKYQINDLNSIISKYPKGGSVLDLGAGSGSTNELFDEKWNWIGLDIEPENGKIIKGDAHSIDFPDNHFEVVISIAVFEHLHSPWIAIKEISRVLKPGGYFFGTTAFLEPEHANSHFHMTRHGISHLMEVAHMSKIFIVPTEGWTVINSMKVIPFPGRKLIGRFRSGIILGLRRSLIKFRILIASGTKKENAIKVLNADRYKYAGSFRFLCQKKK